MHLDFGVEIVRIKCWKHGEHGEQKMLRVVKSSGTPGFVVMGQRIGIKKHLNRSENLVLNLEQKLIKMYDE